MPAEIRLARTGMKKQPHFRIVVADSRKPRDGRFVEVLGQYNPRSADKKVNISKERLEYWIKNGAKPTHTLSQLLRSL